MNSSVTIAALANDRIWVAWQVEERDGDKTKVPYISPRRKARANDPGTWLARAEAEGVAANLQKPFGVGGIGIEFCKDPDTGRSLGGIDLDTCRSPDGNLEPWAEEIVTRLNTYSEVSPSGTGLKAYFTYDTADLDALRGLDLIQPQGFGRKFSGPGKHAPAIEVHLGNRYFAVTEQRFDGTPVEFRHISTADMIWVLRDAGPAFKKISRKPSHPTGQDDSRSAIAFRKGVALCRAGKSFEEMCEALREDPETADWVREKGDPDDQRGLKRIWDAAAAGAPGANIKPSWPTTGWLADVQKDSQQEPRPNLFNVMLALRDDLRLIELFRFDEMRQSALLMQPVPGKIIEGNDAFEPRAVRDDDVTRLQEMLQANGLEKIGRDVVHQAVDARARERSFHPVRNYLDSLEWDGTLRIASWLTTYLGAADSEYHQTVGCMFLTSMVARIYKPGCQCDHMTIFEGIQGEGKSTLLAILGGEWFSDALPDLDGDDVRVSQHLRGEWLIEISEMSAMSKATIAKMKSFISRRVEKFTPKYGRKEVSEPRQCVFAGSTNHPVYLRDETGDRRFWPVKTGTVDLSAVAHDRDQLFAEAVHQYRSGYHWWPARDFAAEFIQPEQDQRYETDAWEQPIVDYLRGKPWITADYPKDNAPRILPLELARHALFIDLAQIDVVKTRRIGAILLRLGWRRPHKGGRGPQGERFFYPDKEASKIEAEHRDATSGTGDAKI